MTGFEFLALLLFSFGALAFGATFIGYLGECRRRRPDAGGFVDFAIVFTCFVWFVVNALLFVQPLVPGLEPWWLWTALMGLTLLFPGLILNDTVTSSKAEFGERHPAWKVLVAALYAAGVGIYVFWLAGLYGWFGVPRQLAMGLGNASIPGLFITMALLSILFVASGRRRRETRKQRDKHRGHLIVLALTILVFVPVALHVLLGAPQLEVFSVLARALPLAFLFAVTLTESRFAFFDVLIKRGVVMLFTLTLLAGAFTLTLPLLDGLQLGWVRPWLSAFLLLPLALVLPWLSRTLEQLLDSAVLGRRYSAEEAVKVFLAELQETTTEVELVARGERGLSTIFRAPAEIRLGLHAVSEGPEARVEVPISAGDRALGVFRMGRRHNDVPYFSQDVALLGSLAGVFAAFLENVRLQQRKQEQEVLARKLSLEASRSELKALRAQINPHFLFNALNAIAGLIHHDPLRADRAVERLAEVFRYTLRGSRREWATLDQELDFAQAYLEVEQARFGPRLETRIAADDSVRPLRVPAMLLQTLVENAVKHGIASVRGPGRIEISASRRDGRLVVEVADNGPGFGDETPPPVEDGDHGIGLSNVRERLRGHFGEQACLTVRRDSDADRTVVGIELPLDALRSADPGAAGSGLS